MLIKFNPTGTHVQNGYLKIRLDIYPETTDKTYSIHHIFVPDETSEEFQAGYQGKLDAEGNPTNPVAYQKWIDALPHVWKLNPMLCHFITVPENITLVELQSQIKGMLTKESLAEVDDVLSKSDIQKVSQIMRTKTVPASKVSVLTDKALLISQINMRLATIEEKI